MSSFGEISEPSTRSAWEDWDEVVIKESFPELNLHSLKEVPEEINTLLIIEGIYLYDYVKSQKELEHIDSKPEINLHLLKTKSLNNYICLIKDYNLVQSGEIVELLKDYITKSNDVVALLTKPFVEYQVAQRITKDYIIRSICTSNQKSNCLNTSFPSLEQPNIIAGVAAGALWLREIIEKPATVLVCYIEHPDEHGIQELQDVLLKYQIISHTKKTQRYNVLTSNLYI